MIQIEIELLIYKNLFVLIRKTNVFVVKQVGRYICKRCLNYYTNRDVLKNHMQKCCLQEITSMMLSNESHLYWKKHFHKNPFYFRIIADFEADHEIDGSNMGNKTNNFCN